MTRPYQRVSAEYERILQRVKDPKIRAYIEMAYKVGHDHGYMQALEERY